MAKVVIKEDKTKVETKASETKSAAKKTAEKPASAVVSTPEKAPEKPRQKMLAVRTAKTIYREGDKVVKLFNSDYRKSDILNEALNQARVEETGLPVPSLIEVCKIDGKWAIVSQYIPGKTLAQLMAENPDKKSEYLDLFVNLQLEILSKREPLLNKLRDKMTRKIGEADLDSTTKYDLHTRLESMSRMVKVCHGDFNPSNVIITPEGKPYVLDWSHVTQGNAGADAARTYLLFYLDGDFNGAEMYLEKFCKADGIEKAYVQKWIPIVAASQLVKARPAEREFLLHWISVVDYQ